MSQLKAQKLRKKKQRKTTILSHISKDAKPYDIPSAQPGTQQEIESELKKLIESFKLGNVIKNGIPVITEKARKCGGM